MSTSVTPPPVVTSCSPAFPASVERAAHVAGIAFALGWMAVLAAIWIRHPGLQHGDSFSDANVLNASRNFEAAGFSTLWGLPYHRATWSPDRPGAPYTHYGPASEWIHEALRRCGLRELSQFRAASLLLTTVALLLFLHVAWRLSGSRVIAALAVFFYAWSAPFSQYADSLREHAYSQLTLFGFLAAWLAYEAATARRARRGWLALAGLCFFCDLWLTFEHVLMIPLFAAGRLLAPGGRRALRGLLLVGLVGAAALGTRLAHNSLAVGGVRRAVEDLMAVAKYRAGRDAQQFSYRELARVWRARLGRDRIRPGDYVAEMAYPALTPTVRWTSGVLFVVLLCVWHAATSAPLRQALGNALLLLLAGGAWLLAMRNHAFIHRHIILLLMPGLALLLAGLATAGLQQWWCAQRAAPVRWVAPLVAIILLSSFAAEMRKSVALNQVVALEPKVHAEVLTRRLASQLRQHAGCRGLANVERLYFAGSELPEAAWEIGRPYQFGALQLPDAIGPRDAVWIDAWSPEQRALAREAYARFGFPDVFASPLDMPLLFRPHQEPGLTADIDYQGLCRLVRMRCARTLDGTAWVLQSVWNLPDPEIAGTLLVAVESTDPVHRSLKGEIRFTDALALDGAVLLNHRLPAHPGPAPTCLRIAVYDAHTLRPLSPTDPTRATLPPDAAWDPDACVITWPSPCATGATSPGP